MGLASSHLERYSLKGFLFLIWQPYCLYSISVHMINFEKVYIYICRDYIVLFEYNKFEFSTKDDERIRDVQQKIMRHS